MVDELDYNALMAFEVFAGHCNFTRAAKVLGLSQPALHKKVNKLVELVGVPLYVRQGRALVLTDAGKMLAAYARQVSSMGADVLARVHAVARRGSVTLASGPGAFLYMLGGVVQEAVRAQFPLKLLPVRSDQARELVLSGQAHLAVGVFDEVESSLCCAPWRTVGQMAVVPEGHVLARRGVVTPLELDGQVLVIAPEGQPHRVATERVLEDAGVSWSVGAEVTGWALMVQFVVYGVGVAIINDCVQLPDGVVGVPVEGFDSVTYSVLSHRDMAHEGALWVRSLLMQSS